jgi:GrpB-like predicted nucleotidyltransferase (UPF0157 family)
MTQRIIKVVPYQTQWPLMFLQEKDLLLSALSDIHVTVHHIGSTSVPDLAAKPIIDILIECEQLSDLDERSEQFESLGYLVKGEYGIAGRRYFQKGGIQHSHHVHAFVKRDDHAYRHLAFRDYLVAHPSIANQYGELKAQGVKKANNDMSLYMAHKNDFITQHEKLAVEYALKQSALEK